MDEIYWHKGLKRITTQSSTLISSSRYLNDARLREWISTEALRRNGRDYPFLYGLPTMIRALDESRDIDRIDALFAAERKINPALDRWLDERFVSRYTKADLAANPEGSIGRRLFDYMDANGFELELDPRLQADPDWKPTTDFEYFNLRSGQTHDFDHILAEVGFDFMSELYPAFFRIGNLFRHLGEELAGELGVLQMFIIWPWVMRTILHYPGAWEAMWDGMMKGYAAGQESAPVFLVRYDDILHLTPAEARERLGIVYRGGADTTRESALWAEGKATHKV